MLLCPLGFSLFLRGSPHLAVPLLAAAVTVAAVFPEGSAVVMAAARPLVVAVMSREKQDRAEGASGLA